MGWLRQKWNHPDNIMRHHPGNISMDSNQAGATMASRYQVAKGAAVVGSMVVPGSAVYKGGRAVTGSTAYKVYGAVKRPVLTVGVHKKVRGAATAMSLSKAYSKALITASVLNFGRNLQLAYAKEYRRLGINLFGPPGSLFLYDMYMAHNMDAESDIDQARETQSRVGRSLPSKPKTRGKRKPNLYDPKPGEKCRPGYVRIDGRCVLRNSTLHKSLMN